MWKFIKSFVAQLFHKHEWERLSSYEMECKSCGDIRILRSHPE